MNKMTKRSFDCIILEKYGKERTCARQNLAQNRIVENFRLAFAAAVWCIDV